MQQRGLSHACHAASISLLHTALSLLSDLAGQVAPAAGGLLIALTWVDIVLFLTLFLSGIKMFGMAIVLKVILGWDLNFSVCPFHPAASTDSGSRQTTATRRAIRAGVRFASESGHAVAVLPVAAGSRPS